MGIVYLGRDPVIGRMVALKTIRAAAEDDQEAREFRERFMREAQAAGILSHPNIVTVHDVGEDPATMTSFIAMEYVEGKNLKQLLQERHPFTYERIAEIVGQVAEALDYAHRRGIVHRDVKPANIIITPEGAVKITDFGIAKIESSTLTSSGQFLGTPNYMSPEQVTGDTVDGRSDLFSLGVALYELLTKKKPFTADNLTSISYKIVHEAFTPPDTYDASIPPEFVTVLEKVLSKDPAQRYQRGNDLALALYEFKAREEERQMLRDLGDMVAEAEKLGPIQAVDGRPASFGPAAVPPIQRPVPPPPEAGSPLTVPIQWPLPPPEPALQEAVEASAPNWDLDEHGAGAPPPAHGASTEIVEASPAPARSAEAESTASRGGRGPSEVRRDAPTELIPAFVPPAPVPAPRTGADAPTELLMRPVPTPEPAVEAPPQRARADAPTELLIPVVPPPVPAPPARPAADAPTELLMRPIPPPEAPAETPPPRGRADAPTELLQAPPGGFGAPPAPPRAPAGPPPEEAGLSGKTEILPAWAMQALVAEPPPAPVPPSTRAPAQPVAATRVPPPPPDEPPAPAAVHGPELDLDSRPTEIITDAAALARLASPAPKPVPPPPPPSPAPAPRAPEPPSRPAAVAPPDVGIPEVHLEPLPPPPARPPEPEAPSRKRIPPLAIVGAALAVVVIAAVVGVGQYRKSVRAKEEAARQEALTRQVEQRTALVAEASRLLSEGKAEPALQVLRQVIQQDPASEAAQQASALVGRAEALVAEQQQAAARAAEVEKALSAAREAAAAGDDARAVVEAEAVLALDPASTEALQLKAEASERLAKATKTAEEQRRLTEAARRKKPTPLPTPVRVAVRPAEPTPTPVPAATPSTATVRIALQSPINDGYVMVRLNDREVFRKAFDFGKRGRGGLVEGTVSVPSGPGEFKVWVIATDSSVRSYETYKTSVPGGESRSLKLDFDAAGKLHVELR